jgi:hypothetical protein
VDITSANSNFTLTPQLGSSVLAGLLPALAGVGFDVQGYASDDAFATEAVEAVEARKGVDGRASFGYVPYLSPQTVTLQADSPSISVFETIINAQKTLRQPIILDGSLSLPSVGRTYALINGAITRLTPIAPARKVLEPVTYTITWDDITGAPV